MKKLISIILVITLTLTLFASCGKTETALTATELLDLGEKYLLDLDYEQAIVYFNQVIEVEPRNSRAYMGAAEAYVGLGDTDSAIDLLKTALEVFADDESVSIELLEMLLEIDPTNVEWYLELARIYINNNDRASAISILKQGMDIVGDDKTRLYAKLIEIDSDTTQWYFELAEVYEALSNIPSAVDTLELGLNNFEDDETKIDFSEELIEIDETNAEWYLTIAYIYIAQGDTDAAIAILREGLEKASDTTEIEALLNELEPEDNEDEYIYSTDYWVIVGDLSETRFSWSCIGGENGEYVLTDNQIESDDPYVGIWEYDITVVGESGFRIVMYGAWDAGDYDSTGIGYSHLSAGSIGEESIDNNIIVDPGSYHIILDTTSGTAVLTVTAN